MMRIWGLIAFAVALSVGPAAALTMRFEQVGNDVSLSVNGPLDLTGLSGSSVPFIPEVTQVYGSGFGGGGFATRELGDSMAEILFEFQLLGSDRFSNGDVQVPLTASSTIDFSLLPDRGTFWYGPGENVGDDLNLDLDLDIIVPNQTLSSLQLVIGSYEYATEDGQPIHVEVVPEPSTGLLVGLGLAAATIQRRSGRSSSVLVRR